MIERMIKTTIVCLADDQAQSLHSLRKLASVHVLPQVTPESGELSRCQNELNELNSVMSFLNSLDLKEYQARGASMQDGAECCRQCVELLEKYNQLQEECDGYDQAIRQLEPWGYFSLEPLKKLEARGWHYALLVRNNTKQARLWFQNLEGRPEGAVECVVKETKDKLYSLVLSPSPLDELNLPVVHFAMGTDLAALEAKRKEILDERQKAFEALKDHAVLNGELLQNEKKRMVSEIAFLKTRDGMGHAGSALCYLQGYVPQDKVEELRQTAQQNGWALRYEEVTEDDSQVPTKLRLPKHFEMAKCILDFIGILPGYTEVDISIAVMIFLSIFCGMLVGDAGYGALFCIATGWGLWKAVRTRNNALKQAMQLLLGMSLCTLIWGGLSGNWFGLSWGGIEWLTNNERGQFNAQLFCFFLAAIHLSMGHLWKLSLVQSWRDRLGNLGWALFLWGNFFTVKCLLIDYSFENFTIPKYLYLVGAALIVSCGINWKNVGDVIYSPFTFINSIGDVLSYIRLYAVGLSSLFIAKAFNDMATMIWANNKLLVPVGLVIILAGHLLNVCMALMSVLVHGIRLNTLEFSGHIGVEWSGRAYKPFE